jgi:dTMP kinase
LENQILPALRAGFIVLTDRYIYSAIARAVVRGADPNWIRAIYGIALCPDAIFYLRVQTAEELAGRVLASGRGFDYWESGMDMGLGNDYYDSFVTYQKMLLKEFDRMRGEYNFEVIHASRPVKRVATALRNSIKRMIETEPAAPAEPALKEVPKPEIKEKPTNERRPALTKPDTDKSRVA